MTYLGGASFAWQSDHGQFYLIDSKDHAFLAPVDITPEMTARNYYAPATGLVVYTHDCLQQRIDIVVYDAEPAATSVEAIRGQPWNAVETTHATFPSGRFAVSSPSRAVHRVGPFFVLGTQHAAVRISWMQIEGNRYDSTLIEPDVIQIELWPR